MHYVRRAPHLGLWSVCQKVGVKSFRKLELLCIYWSIRCSPARMDAIGNYIWLKRKVWGLGTYDIGTNDACTYFLELLLYTFSKIQAQVSADYH